MAVAHLGDARAFLAMRLMMKAHREGSQSSLLSSSPMEGVVEESDDESDDDIGRGGAGVGGGSVSCACDLPFPCHPSDSAGFLIYLPLWRQ